MYALGWLAAIFVELIVLSITQNIILLGILIITFGFLFLDVLRHGHAASLKGVIAAAVYCFIWGALLLFEPMIKNTDFLGEKYGAVVFTLGLGLLFLIMGLYTTVFKMFCCSQKVPAVVAGAVEYSGRNGSVYSPKFAFLYDGRKYCVASGESFSKRKIQKKFQEGKACFIWVNPKNPRDISVGKGIGKGSFSMLFMGVAGVAVGVWIILQ